VRAAHAIHARRSLRPPPPSTRGSRGRRTVPSARNGETARGHAASLFACAWGPTLLTAPGESTPRRSRSRLRTRSASRLSLACRGSPRCACRSSRVLHLFTRGATGWLLQDERAQSGAKLVRAQTAFDLTVCDD